MRGGGYASVFRSGARGVVMMFGLELTTKTEGTDSSASPVARRPGAAVERDMSMVCGRASAPGAAHPIARNATRRSKRSVLFAFLVVIPVSRYSIPRRGPAAESTAAKYAARSTARCVLLCPRSTRDE